MALFPGVQWHRASSQGIANRGGGETVRAKSDPVGQGLYYRNEDFVVADCVQAVAKERGVSGPQVALAWLLNKPHIVAPIIGVTKMGHLDQAIAALQIKLEKEEIKRLEEPYQPHSILGHS